MQRRVPHRRFTGAGDIAAAEHEVTRRSRRESVVHQAVGELVAEAGAQLGGQGNGPAAQAHDSVGPVEACAGDVKRTSERQPFVVYLNSGGSVKRHRFLGEESGCGRAIGVGVAVAAGRVEAGAGAASVTRVGDELTRRVETVVGGEGGGEAGEEAG